MNVIKSNSICPPYSDKDASADLAEGWRRRLIQRDRGLHAVGSESELMITANTTARPSLTVGSRQAHPDPGGPVGLPEGSNMPRAGHRTSFWNCTGRLLPGSRGGGAGLAGIVPTGFLWHRCTDGLLVKDEWGTEGGQGQEPKEEERSDTQKRFCWLECGTNGFTLITFL